ncbi:MAG: hypothetical protein COW12_01100, partial [Candidatus Omnitrophica bacterium CG12_big_fil_rev_8_21_14_0_65_45_16]
QTKQFELNLVDLRNTDNTYLSVDVTQAFNQFFINLGDESAFQLMGLATVGFVGQFEFEGIVDLVRTQFGVNTQTGKFEGLYDLTLATKVVGEFQNTLDAFQKLYGNIVNGKIDQSGALFRLAKTLFGQTAAKYMQQHSLVLSLQTNLGETFNLSGILAQGFSGNTLKNVISQNQVYEFGITMTIDLDFDTGTPKNVVFEQIKASLRDYVSQVKLNSEAMAQNHVNVRAMTNLGFSVDYTGTETSGLIGKLVEQLNLKQPAYEEAFTIALSKIYNGAGDRAQLIAEIQADFANLAIEFSFTPQMMSQQHITMMASTNLGLTFTYTGIQTVGKLAQMIRGQDAR